MVMLATLCTLVGAVLGLRFRVVVLVPAIAAGLVLIAAGAPVFGLEPWRGVLGVVVAATALQVGFLCGSGIRIFMAAAHLATVRRPSETAVSRPAR